MNEGVTVGEIDPTANGDKIVVQGVFLQCIGRCNKMGIDCAKGCSGILAVLQPETLIGGIVPNIIGLSHIEFDKETPVLQGRRVQGHSVTKCYTDEVPFACCCIPDCVRNEEKLVNAVNDLW